MFLLVGSHCTLMVFCSKVNNKMFPLLFCFMMISFGWFVYVSTLAYFFMFHNANSTTKVMGYDGTCK